MKKIEYSFTLASSKKYVTVVITKQTHVGQYFGSKEPPYFFKASNGLFLYSGSFPQVISNNQVYLRGDSRRRDFDKLKMSNSLFKKFQKAVEEYNEHFSTKEGALISQTPTTLKNIKDISREEFYNISLYDKLMVIFEELKRNAQK